jgi:hypothetical protein
MGKQVSNCIHEDPLDSHVKSFSPNPVKSIKNLFRDKNYTLLHIARVALLSRTHFKVYRSETQVGQSRVRVVGSQAGRG